MRFYGELSDFLPNVRRGVAFECALPARRSVKDLIESLGVPHCEAFVVLVDDAAVGFDHVVAGGERIAVYPEFSELDLPAEALAKAGATGLAAARAPSPTDGRFVLDGHLGRLAAYLRAAGFDVAYDRDAADDAIARVAAQEDRVVLTRDVGLLKRAIVRHGRFVRATAPRAQLAEIVRRFRLADGAAPFTRCLRCNTPLVAVTKDDARGAVPARILERFDDFSRCPTCRRTFWRGTHHERIAGVIRSVVGHS